MVCYETIFPYDRLMADILCSKVEVYVVDLINPYGGTDPTSAYGLFLCGEKATKQNPYFHCLLSLVPRNK